MAYLYTIGLFVLVVLGLLFTWRRRMTKAKLNANKSDLSKKSHLHCVVTGGSRGIGFALVKELLETNPNHKIVYCSSNLKNIEKSYEQLALETGLDIKGSLLGKSLFACECDITNYDQVNGVLVPFIKEKLDRVDVWINNAGSGDCRKKLEDMSQLEIVNIVNVNTLGTIYCTQAAIKFIKNQSGDGGHVFLMEGLGSDGRKAPEMSIYGMTKASYRQFVSSLVEENKETKVGIHRLSPGMVITSMLVPENSTKHAKIFNILAEDRDIVAKFLISKVVKVHGTNTFAAFLTPLGVIFRFLTFFTRKNKFFDENGQLKEKYAKQW